ncbi:hypothetical protein A3460_10765 [Enterobacter roggenkampii]|nr:hypothetical protein A3460_10765 [Enterobacter roggenkampii]
MHNYSHHFLNILEQADIFGLTVHQLERSGVLIKQVSSDFLLKVKKPPLEKSSLSDTILMPSSFPLWGQKKFMKFPSSLSGHI